MQKYLKSCMQERSIPRIYVVKCIVMKKFFLIVLSASVAAVSCSYADYGYVYDMPRQDAGIMINGNMPEPPGEGGGDNFDKIVENPFIKVSEQPVSTFSVDADGASYTYVRRMLREGRGINPNAVRTEEFLNYFTFDYADPTGDESVAANAEIGECPWAPGHMLLRIGLKGKSLTESEIPPANYVLLVDVSGSMRGDDRIELLKSGLCNMIDYMRPDDRVAIITYASGVSKALESTQVKNANKIKKVIKSLDADGSTAGGAAMKMAYEEASEHFIKGANNRIIMCTDGDFNVGVSSTEALVEMVESYMDKGIYLSIMGFGTGNYQDSRMESLSNHGNGTYTYIDSEDEMMKVFVHERSRFYSVANDTKCQVKFFDWVDSYRLIGYENRVLDNEDFENDKKDAGEIGAGQTVTALYELIPAEGDMTQNATAASLDVRYKKALGEESRLLHVDIGKYYKGTTVTGKEFDFAAGIAAFALTLRNSEYKGDASYDMAKELVEGAVKPADGVDPLKFRPQLLTLIDSAKKAAQSL